MADFLVIRRLPGRNDTVEWLVVDDQGALVDRGDQDPLADLSGRASGRRLVLLAPALEVLLTSAAVPVRGTARILQALPFAMEEQLADEVENLHFAAGARRDDGRVRVAVTRSDRIEGWLEDLSAAQLDPVAVYSEAEGLDQITGTAVLLIEGDLASLRSADGNIASTDLEGLDALVELWLAAQARDGDEAPLPQLLVYLAGDISPQLAADLEGLRARLQSLELRSLPDSALPRLAANLAVQPGINLLQGAFARRSNLARFWPAWRLVAMLLATLAVVMIATVGAYAWQSGRRAEALEKSVEQAFLYTFPDARQVRDPRAQLQSRLRALGQAEGPAAGQFLDTLQAVARAVSKAPGTKLEGLDYRSGTMELRLRAPNVEVLDRIRQDIGASGGLDTEIQSANADNEEVLGRLRIRPRGA